jgi:hypothetical protein
VITPNPTADLAHLTSWALERGLELEDLTVESASLEDVYLRLVGGEGDGVGDDEGDRAGDGAPS